MLCAAGPGQRGLGPADGRPTACWSIVRTAARRRLCICKSRWPNRGAGYASRGRSLRTRAAHGQRRSHENLQRSQWHGFTSATSARRCSTASHAVPSVVELFALVLQFDASAGIDRCTSSADGAAVSLW